MMLYHKIWDTIIFLIYIDDSLVIGNIPSLNQNLIDNLTQFFLLKDLKELNYFLGVEVGRTQDSLHMSQIKNVKYLIKQNFMIQNKYLLLWLHSSNSPSWMVMHL